MRARQYGRHAPAGDTRSQSVYNPHQNPRPRLSRAQVLRWCYRDSSDAYRKNKFTVRIEKDGELGYNRYIIVIF